MQKHGLRAKVANKIRLLRLRRKMTQEEVAELTGFHYKYYQRVESGKANLTLDSVERFVKAFKCHPRDFFP